jgi:hypothetical protein
MNPRKEIGGILARGWELERVQAMIGHFFGIGARREAILGRGLEPMQVLQLPLSTPGVVRKDEILDRGLGLVAVDQAVGRLLGDALEGRESSRGDWNST